MPVFATINQSFLSFFTVRVPHVVRADDPEHVLGPCRRHDRDHDRADRTQVVADPNPDGLGAVQIASLRRVDRDDVISARLLGKNLRAQPQGDDRQGQARHASSNGPHICLLSGGYAPVARTLS